MNCIDYIIDCTDCKWKYVHKRIYRGSFEFDIKSSNKIKTKKKWKERNEKKLNEDEKASKNQLFECFFFRLLSRFSFIHSCRMGKTKYYFAFFACFSFMLCWVLNTDYRHHRRDRGLWWYFPILIVHCILFTVHLHIHLKTNS